MKTMTVIELDALLVSLNVRGFRVLYVAGECWAICSKGVGVGPDLATAIASMVAIVKEARTRRVRHDGHHGIAD